MEAFWSTLKHERVYRTDFLTHDEAGLQIFDSICRSHGTRRPRGSIGCLASANFEATFQRPKPPLLPSIFPGLARSGLPRKLVNNQFQLPLVGRHHGC